MRPRKFNHVGDAIRWSMYGGLALALDKSALLASSAQKSESAQWARYYAGHAGCTFLTVEHRGTYSERIQLTAEQAARVAEQSLDGPSERPKSDWPTTVVFFTGSRKGCHVEQLEGLRAWLYAREILAGHHGCCVGADEEFHNILAGLRELKRFGENDSYKWMEHTNCPWVTGWPARVPDDLTCYGRVKLDDERGKEEPLRRNRNMAEYAKWYANSGKRVDVLAVACPFEHEPPTNGRGGTWHAIRMFRGCDIPVTIIDPDGVAHG